MDITNSTLVWGWYILIFDVAEASSSKVLHSLRPFHDSAPVREQYLNQPVFNVLKKARKPMSVYPHSFKQSSYWNKSYWTKPGMVSKLHYVSNWLQFLHLILENNRYSDVSWQKFQIGLQLPQKIARTYYIFPLKRSQLFILKYNSKKLM